jgi:hypothetical protein
MKGWLVPAAIVLLALFGFCGYRIGNSEVPYLRAEIALREALTASAGGTIPDAVELRLPPDSVRPPRTFFAQPYRLEYIDNYLAGARWRDLLAPGWLVWTIHFADGKNWEANVLATSDSTHIVSLTPDDR